MPNKQKYGILVYCEKTFSFVTHLNDRNAKWDVGQRALLFASKAYAKDIPTGLCLNGFPAMLVEIPNYMENLLVNLPA